MNPVEAQNIRRINNPPNPYHSQWLEWIDAPPPAKLEIYIEQVKSIVTRITSPDLGVEWSVNPYRGCMHSCAYCYARPFHQYLDWGAGTDFERKIVVKINAAKVLRATLCKRTWKQELITFSGITDCYQPLESQYEITKQCLEACVDFRNPVGIITKGALIVRDVELIARLHSVAPRTGAGISIAFADDSMSAKLEPATARPSTRFRALKILSEAGIPTTVGVAPIIPGLNDDQIVEILERAYEAGARRAFKIMLRLPAEVKDVFIPKLQEKFPLRYERVVNNIKSMRGGKLYNSNFGDRMVGEGEKWNMIESLFELTCRKLGMNIPAMKKEEAAEPGQLGLF